VQFLAGEILDCAADDPDFGDVVLLLHFSGADGSTTFIDSSSFANPVNAEGGAQVSDSARFGSGSLFCDGSGGVITDVNTTLQDEGLSPTNTSPFTIECWAYFSSINVIQILVAVDQGLFLRVFRLRQAGDDEIQFEWSTSAGSTFDVSLSTTAANLTTGTWYHIAVDKDSTGKLRIYINGVMKASDTPANSTITATAGAMSVGMQGLGSFQPFHGWIDEVRITRGVSRYGDVHGDSSFAPPSAAFPNG
jgi:hypothetical protein